MSVVHFRLYCKAIIIIIIIIIYIYIVRATTKGPLGVMLYTIDITYFRSHKFRFKIIIYFEWNKFRTGITVRKYFQFI